jgi:O-antigen/teichoic acid export membrane protein
MHNSCGPEESNQTKTSGLRGRLLKGLGAQGFSQAVQIFIRLAEVPLLLSFWGTQLYGEWLMLSAIPVYFTISDGGFAGAACREMTMRSSAKNRTGVIAVFQSTWVLLVVVSFVMGLMAFSFVRVAPLGEWLGFSSMTAFEVKAVFLLLALHVLVSFQGDLLNGGFWVSGSYPYSMSLIAFTQLIEFVGLAAAVALGGGPMQAATGYLVGRVLGTGIMWIGMRQVSPWLTHGFIHSSWSGIKRLAPPAFASLAFPLANAFNIQGIRLIVGLTIGPSAVAVFVPLRTLSRLVMQPGAIIGRLIQPELALAYGAKDSSLFQLIFIRSCQLAMWFCFGACLIVGPGAYWIFPLWTGGMVSMHWPTYLILLAAVLTNTIWHTALMVPYAINDHGRIAIYYLFVYGLMAFGLSHIWSANLGIGGAALGLLVAEVAMVLVVINACLKLTHMKLNQWAKKVVLPPFKLIYRTGVHI